MSEALSIKDGGSYQATVDQQFVQWKSLDLPDDTAAPTDAVSEEAPAADEGSE